MKSIRIKLIAPFLIGLLALALSLSAYTYASARRAVENAVLIVSEAKTNQVEASMSLLFKSLLSTVQNIVVDPHVLSLFDDSGADSPLRKSTDEWVEILTQGNEYYRDIFITDKDGKCIVSSNPGLVGKSFGQMPIVARALGGMFTLDDFSVGLITKKLSATVAGPIDTGNEIEGTIVIVCDFPRIVNYGEADADSNVIFTALLEPQGLFAAHKDDSLMGNERALFPQLYNRLRGVGNQGGKVEYSLGGRSYIGYARIEPVTRWLVLTSGLESEVFASASRMGLTVFGISLAVLCVVSFIVVRLANGILNTLMSLIGYAKRVSEGDFDSRLEATKRDDELGTLHRSLARLVDRLQSMLFQTQEASRIKGEFLANMSHEIRTPINAIIGLAYLSLRDTEMSAKQRDSLEKIQTAARSLLGVINDILDISKIEAGKLVLEKTSFDVRQLLKDTFSIHQLNAHTKSLALTMHCDPDVPERLMGDPLRIGQILNNLLSNAVKFTPKGGVSLGCRLIEQDEMCALIRIDVSDTGIGIDRESLDKLFQPFTQADASITRQFGGTGLGLAISASLLALMAGKLDVASEPGKGSTFSVTLRLEIDTSPSSEREEECPTEEDFERLGLKGKVVLIAEDNLINQTILEELIAPSGATVVLADNGQEALETVKSKHVDLVFMDMQMPIMDGLQATRAIRAVPGMDILPIIAVTANAMREDREEGLASGMNDYITKPVEIKQLYETLRTWLPNA